MADGSRAVLLGSQTPTHRLVPECEFSRGPEAIELGELAGYKLFPYQKNYLIDTLGVVYVPSIRHEDGRLVEKWASYETLIELARRNGKSVAEEVRALAGIYLFGERRVVYSAHKDETAKEAFERIGDAIHSDGELKAELKRTSRTNGRFGYEFKSGQTIRFRTRTGDGGRGLDGDCVIIDEVQAAKNAHLAALMPLVSARPNGQLRYAGSAGGRKAEVLGKLVKRMTNGSARLTGYRFAADEDDPPGEPETWAKTNPLLGYLLAVEALQSEYEQLPAEDFALERLTIGDYPREEGEDWVIPRRRWERGEDPDSAMVGPVLFAVEIKWDRTRAAIGVAGYRPDRSKHIEVIADEVGTLWTVQELVRLTAGHANLGVVIDPGSPAKSLIGPLRDANVKVHLLKTEDLTLGYASMYDAFAVEPPLYWHTGGLALTSALAVASVRTVGGATTWRRAGAANAAGVLACCWAAHYLDVLAEKKDVAPPRRATGAPGNHRRELARSGGFDPRSSGF